METPPPPEEDHFFAPANHKLVSVYLRRRVSGEPLPSAAAAYFHDVDIYSADPATLTAGLLPLPARKGEGSSWLFFTPVKAKSSTDSRRCRRVGLGLSVWHSEHAPEAVVDDEGKRVGHRQLFSFKNKSGRRSGWSMWEFAADQEGGETLLALCKIHQGHASSRRRADGSAVRSARKRKATDGGIDEMAPAPVKRRLFALAPPPPSPEPPAASADGVVATAEAICGDTTKTQALLDEPDVLLDLDADPMFSDMTKTQALLGELDVMLGAVFSDKTEASKDTPSPVMSKINTTLTPVHSFSPRPPDAPKISASMECPTTAGLLTPEPEAIPSSRTETEASKDAPRSVMVFLDGGEAYPSQPDEMNATSRSLSSFAPWENIISSTVESPATFLVPETQASQGEIATINCGFLMDDRDPSPLEYWYNGSFTDGSGHDISGVPLSAPDSEISGTWTGCNMPSYCSVGNAFPGGFPNYAGPPASLSGYDTMASCSGNNVSIGALPTYSEGVSRFAGVQYGCGCCAPFTPLLPSVAPSWWCGSPSFWSC